MYNLMDYGRMMRDEVRVNAHYQALKQVVRPGDVVIDIGAGTGIFALMACQLGASRVYAIEPTAWVNLGRQMAATSGFADRIVFIRDYSGQLILPEPGDVVIGDLRGATPIVTPHILSLVDAHRRFLKPEGIMIPRRDVVYAALVSAPETYSSRVRRPWLENSYGVNMEAGFKYMVNTPDNLEAAQISDLKLLFPGQVWAEIDYRRLETTSFATSLDWVADEAATAHAIFCWFNAELADGIGYTSAPWETPYAPVYGNLWLFLQTPLDIEPEDRVSVVLQAMTIPDGYLYVWNTTLRSKTDEIKSELRQTSFMGQPIFS